MSAVRDIEFWAPGGGGEAAWPSQMEEVLTLGEGNGVAAGKGRGDDVVSSDEELQPEEEIIPTVRQ